MQVGLGQGRSVGRILGLSVATALIGACDYDRPRAGDALGVPGAGARIDTDAAPNEAIAATQRPDVEFNEVARFDAALVDLAWYEPSRLYVALQDGRVRTVDPASGESHVVLDISDIVVAEGEGGLLGLVFAPHPDGQDPDAAYVSYTDPDRDGALVVDEYVVSSEGAFDADSRREVILIEQPFSNHNGGDLAIGPDDYLYIGVGDGGGSQDQDRTALDLTLPLGKLLRIDPTGSGGGSYAIPPDNPFAEPSAGEVPEIWASGLRNPWKFTFDPVTGDLWIADVGQYEYEEVNLVTRPNDGSTPARGASFGWSAYEGTSRFNDDVVDPNHTPPVFTYVHGDECSISGGAPYRGSAIPSLGTGYVYGDYCSGSIWVLDLISGRSLPLGTVEAVTGIIDGPKHELYVLSGTGGLSRIEPAS